ncbi:MAG: hypothetical protein COV31_01170 [Candidatus Yanofskybacteria bacterium CG10_big_fil_rev_8_21_14_0_10_46_23]|uniref:LexA repressor n=1 Tax=Candidatus Yanofskybacteria bacterium CG10_big_fil_rev_8_21_14_0_10_46_23 TaxID=1975098 RepID=A0A2H0R4K6_9BACT|nr:MAG: hypothetical protein COV31_01170 [Candidatus Yanofskybacteria bacterium CG10_big_fil_rev_8_21_14_0_10_46_23]
MSNRVWTTRCSFRVVFGIKYLYMATLTKRQQELYTFIEGYIRENGISPTINEIQKKFGLKSPATVHEHIGGLIEKKLLARDDYSTRGLNIRQTTEIPIVGIIAAGQPIEAIENFDATVAVSNSLLNKDSYYYALRVAGDSMVDEGIFDGDTVVIKKQAVAENGQTVVAIIDNNEATLKKIYREKDRVRLQPSNQSHLPIYRSEVEIRGILIKIIHKQPKTIPVIEKNGFKTIDLFAGIGGLRLGFESAGFDTVFANDFEPKCKYTYDLNFPTSKLIVEDVRKIGIDDLPEFDFLLGGFPCQAFSIAGYREGFGDKKDRGNLFFDIARIIEARKPRGFLLENVKNLKSHDDGRTFKIIKETLVNLGYYVKAKVLNSMEYGNVPQNRERIYIVGFKNKKHADCFEFPDPVPLTTSMSDILEKNVGSKYYYNNKPLFPKLAEFVKDKGRVYQWRRQYVRENKKGVCPTLTANMGTGGHNVPIIKDEKGIRKLTPLECARVQGFPSNYKLPAIADSALYKQIGNSVTVPVVKAVARQIIKAMRLD